MDSTATAFVPAVSSGPFQAAARPPRKIHADRRDAERGEQDDGAVAARADRLGEPGLVPEQQAGVADDAAAEHDRRVAVADRELVQVVVAAALGVGEHLQRRPPSPVTSLNWPAAITVMIADCATGR